MSEKMIEVQGVTKSFGDLLVLKGIDLVIYKGEVVSIVGPSGAGKTTLLQIMGTLDKADSGKVYIDGTDVGELKEKQFSAGLVSYSSFISCYRSLRRWRMS